MQAGHPQLMGQLYKVIRTSAPTSLLHILQAGFTLDPAQVGGGESSFQKGEGRKGPATDLSPGPTGTPLKSASKPENRTQSCAKLAAGDLGNNTIWLGSLLPK